MEERVEKLLADADAYGDRLMREGRDHSRPYAQKPKHHLMIKRHPTLGWVNRSEFFIWKATCICEWETAWTSKARMKRLWKAHKET